MKNLKVKIALGLSFLTLSVLFLLTILNQELSSEFMRWIIGGNATLLWTIIPNIITILSLVILFTSKEKFTRFMEITITLLLISNITFLLFLNLAQTNFGIIFIMFSVWGISLSVVIILSFKLLYSAIFTKNCKEVVGYLLKVRVVKSILLSVTITVVLFQLYLVANAIEVYKAVKVQDVSEKNNYSLFSFYRPYVYEIRSGGKRWSYGRVKFVDNGR